MGKDSSKHEVVVAMKSEWIFQYLASDAVRLQENKYATEQQQKRVFYFLRILQ